MLHQPGSRVRLSDNTTFFFFFLHSNYPLVFTAAHHSFIIPQGSALYKRPEIKSLLATYPRATKKRKMEESADASSAMSSLMCYTCFQKGHLSRMCPSKRGMKKCTGCGISGHSEATCYTLHPELRPPWQRRGPPGVPVAAPKSPVISG